jgi:signal transduction histidine kinase
MRRFEATFSPILDGSGAVAHVVEVWRDVTDRTELEVQLSHSERLASVGILAAGVAHEINNPLASMMAGIEGLGRWLKRGQFDEEGVREAVTTIELLEREIERGRQTTEKLMLLGRSYNTAPGWVDVNRAVRDTLLLLRYELRTREIETVEELESKMPQIWAREAGVRGICMNLMINAVQAMNGGGRLTVTTRHRSELVELSVGDTGPGIAPEHLERIWDPFFTTKPVGQGTGLGLSITSRIVTRHGGRIAVKSEPGRGARFDVELPVHGAGGEA